MKVAVLLLLTMGYLIDKAFSDGGGHEKHNHVKIVVPVYKHDHKHTHTIIKQPVKKVVVHKHYHQHGHGHDHGHNHKHGHDHKHDHHHKHGHDHKHGHHHKHGHNHKHGHDHGHKHKHAHHHDHKGGDHHHHDTWSNHDGWDSFKPSRQVDSYGNPLAENALDYEPHSTENFEDDTYLNSLKSIRSESYQVTEAKNSEAGDPVGQYLVTGSYKVQEPENIKYHNIFQAPLADINLHDTNIDEPPGDEGLEGASEEFDYEEQDERSGEASSPDGVLGYEAVKQFFHKKVQR